MGLKRVCGENAFLAAAVNEFEMRVNKLAKRMSENVLNRMMLW